jgi:AcrR family transcriptional regulator
MAAAKSTAAARKAVKRRKPLTREDKRQANRARILQAARKVFGRLGYRGATIEGIADEAALSNGAVYYNFENKEDLFLALLDEWRAELLRDVESAFAGPADGGAPALQLQKEVRQILATLRRSREWRLLLLEFVTYAARNAKFRARFVAGRRKFKAALTNALEERIAALGVQPGLPAEHLALLVTALVNGLSVDELTEPGTVPDGLLGEAVSALLESRRPDSLDD